MRMHGHGAHDDMSYVPPELFAEWEARDPVERYAARLIADLGFATEEVEAIREEVRTLVAECAERALASPMPDPARAARASSPTAGSRSATAWRHGRAGPDRRRVAEPGPSVERRAA